MLEVKYYIEARKNYPISRGFDDWVEEINNMELQEEVFFVVPESFLYLLHNEQRKTFDKRYNIAGVFDVGSPYTNTAVKMVLIYAVSEKVESINVAILNAPVFNVRKNRTGKDSGLFETPQEYYSKFDTYVEVLENWINKGITPDHDKEGAYEYNTIPLEDINFEKLFPRYYSRQAMEIRRLSSTEQFVKLSDVAEILIPKEDRSSIELVKRIRPADFKYPLDVYSIPEAKPTNIILQKGDIVFPTAGNTQPYLYNADIEEKIYASPFTAVIKCKDILPEYLFLYLLSDTAAYLVNMIKQGVGITRVSVKDLKELSIVKPTLEAEKYINDFNILSSVTIRNYGKAEYSYSSSKRPEDSKVSFVREDPAPYNVDKPKKIEDILNVEMASKIKVHNEAQLRSFLTDDLRELNTCFRGKAYKATLILAGSILEAVLIDWLSEIDHKNYFDEEYTVTDRYGRAKRADLIDYINEIKEIEKPNWMEEADKAHAIRKKRNLVHAKLCLKSDEINETVCKQVIEYLKDVLKTRGVEE